MEYDQHDDMWTNSGHAQTTTLNNTLSWDTQHSFYPSYAQSKLAKKNIGLPFLTEAPLNVFEPILALQSQSPVIHESDLVKSLIQAIVGLPSIYFYWQQNQFKMRAGEDLRILGVSTLAIKPILQQLLDFGTKLKVIEHIATTLNNNPEQYGSIGVSLGCCLSELHVHIQHAIISVFEKEQQAMTVLKVYQYVYQLISVTEKLHTLFNNNMHKFGVDWINMLYVEIQQFDLLQTGNHALYRDICLAMLRYTSVPYLTMLSRWLGLDSDYNSGVLDDPCNEFYITTKLHIQDILERFEVSNKRSKGNM
jgi:hypothetical protein